MLSCNILKSDRYFTKQKKDKGPRTEALTKFEKKKKVMKNLVRINNEGINGAMTTTDIT